MTPATAKIHTALMVGEQSAAKPIAYAVLTFRAFRLTDGTSHEVDIGEPETLAEAVNAAKVRCFHKDHLAIRETGFRLRQWRNCAEEVPVDRLHLFAIKRKSIPRYEGTFSERRVHDLYADPVTVLPGEVFTSPVREGRALAERGDIEQGGLR